MSLFFRNNPVKVSDDVAFLKEFEGEAFAVRPRDEKRRPGYNPPPDHPRPPYPPGPPDHKLNSDRTVAVATDYYWNEDMDACPRGVKVQLLGSGGVASYGTYNGRDPFWVSWAPVPKRRPK